MDTTTGQPQTAVTDEKAAAMAAAVQEAVPDAAVPGSMPEPGQESGVPNALLQRLFARPKTFTFLQAVRLLMRAHGREWGSARDFLRYGLAVHPELSLAHPGTDITDLVRCDTSGQEPDPASGDGQTAGKPDTVPGHGAEHAQRARFAMTVTFLALYGASSPLPAFYTEELIEEARNDHDESRRFLDIFNQALYVLYYRACVAGRLGQRALEEGDGRIAGMLQALAGRRPALDHAGSPHQGELPEDIACIPLLARHTRSARGLEIMLQFLLDRADIVVEQCLPRVLPVPAAQRARLGSMRLGEDVIGATVTDLEGAFRIHVLKVTREEVRDYLPGGTALARMRAIVQRYLHLPLAWDLVLHLADNATRPASLGACSLGVSAFLCETGSVPARTLRIAAHLRADSRPCVNLGPGRA